MAKKKPTPALREEEFSTVALPTSQEDPQETARQEATRQEAFNAQYAWRGKRIVGLTSSRKDFWNTLCHRAGLPSLNDLTSARDVMPMVPAMKALVFTCSISTDTLLDLQALGIKAQLRALMEWTDENVSIAEEGEVTTIGLRLLNDSIKNAARPVPRSGDDPKN